MQNIEESSISVILPNYNGKDLLTSNLPPLINALNNANCKYEIIVVDDCSTDESIKTVNECFPEVIVLKNDVNKGFSTTCNNGIFSATCDLLCVVNTDVTFELDYFKKAIPHFKNKNLFSLKGNIINYNSSFDDVINIEKISLLYFKSGFLRFNQRIEYIPNSFTGKVGGQFTLLGCAFICERKKMLKLKGFDEIFSPYYWEDADIAIRALRSGYELGYDPKCIVYHKTSSTISTYVSNRKRRLTSIRNKFIFTWRHLQGSKQWFLHIFFTTINLLTRWIILDWKYYVSFYRAILRLKDYNIKGNYESR